MGTSKLLGKPDEMLGVNLRWTSTPSRRSSNIPYLVASCYGNRDKLRLCGPLQLVRVQTLPFYTGTILSRFF